MKQLFLLLLATCISTIVSAQFNLPIVVKETATGNRLAGASISTSTKTGTSTNSNGFALLENIPDGKLQLTISFLGKESITKQLDFPRKKTDTLFISLTDEEEEEELDEVVIQSTRTGRTIRNTATRVELIDGEELDEKNNMRPANVSMLLHESTGLQVQQTSATTGNASIRVQGLDGRYTQLLKDGYPNFGNFASGLSVLEIPPLDLKQVEVIKGPSSTLYGGGAIAGVINFISKKPTDEFEGNVMLNRSNIGQSNIGLYASQKKNKFGYAILATANAAKPYDVDNDEFTEIPESRNYNLNPRLYFYPDEKTTIMLGHSFVRSKFTGGDMQVIKGNPDADHVYFERNSTYRNTSTLELNKNINSKNSFTLRQSLSFYDRQIETPGNIFSGINTNSFTDINYKYAFDKHNIISGINIISDKFDQKQNSSFIDQNNKTFTGGLYVQDTWDAAENIIIESGIRVDNVSYSNTNFKKNQTFILPRFSGLFIYNNKFSSRISAGLGYKTPTIFTEETESRQYKNVLPLNDVTAEKSIGGTADLNFKTRIGNDLSFSFNQLFYITRINKPLVFQNDSNGYFLFSNAKQPVVSKGFETNAKLIYRHDLKLFAGYTFTNARAKYKTGNDFLILLPKHKLNLVLMYEKEDNFKLGLEGYFTDKQLLSNGNYTPSFWEFGFMAQKTVKKFSFFINFENFTDQRQSRYKPVVNQPHTSPTFDEIWNHTEGFVFNGGVKIKF